MFYHNIHKTLIGAALTLLIAAGASIQVSAQTCDLPLSIKMATPDANILLLFDSSGSMNIAIYHDAYDPNFTYSGKFRASRTYYVSSNGYYRPYDFNTNWTTTPSAPLVRSDNGQDGWYEGNYMNWIYYYATDAQRAELPQMTRVQVAKAAVNAIIADNPTVRFGVWKYNGSNYGLNVVPVGTDPATVASAINGITADGYTPIAESMVTIWNDVNADPNAIQYECQKTFCVIVTDGLPTQDTPVESWAKDADGDGFSVDEVAYYFRTHDADGSLPGDQIINTYTIGFGVDANILQDAADQGDGLYISANNPTELSKSLERVLRDIINRISAGSAVAVVSTEGHAQDFLFRGKFMPGRWQGFLEAFELPYTPGEAPYWEAGSLLASRTASSRTIFTSVNDSPIELVDNNAATLLPYMSVATEAEAIDLINWMRGEEIVGYRDRAGWKLGDVVDSSPLVVGPPSGFTLMNDYLTWRDAHANRTRVVYIGSNDGMVHCFRESDGSELWAYAPQNVLGRIKDLADPDYCHEFFCNLTPKVADVYLEGSWRSILLCGEKQGGSAYFAIDVTYPENPVFMWEELAVFDLQTWSQPSVVRIEGQFNDEPVLFMGSGPEDPAIGQSYLLVHSLINGDFLGGWVLDATDGTETNMSSAVRPLDLDFDGFTDVLYLSELKGNLWRFATDPSGWLGLVGTKLFIADPGQHMQAQPILTVDYNNDVFCYFGTGKYLDADDINDPDLQTFYAITDKHDGLTVDKAQLVDQTNSIQQIGVDDRGWYIDLVQAIGERIVEPDALVAGVVYFTTFAPDAGACGVGGHSWLYAVDFRDGSAEDGDDTTDDGVDGRVEDLGEGVGTKPVVDILNDEVIVQGSDTRIHLNDTKVKHHSVVVKSWRQRYQ